MTADSKRYSSPNQVKHIPVPDVVDSVASKEDSAFSEVDGYAKESRRQEHLRAETLRRLLHKFVLLGVMIVGALLLVGVLVWGWHVLLPMNLRWLSIDEIVEIQKIMSSALLALVISDYSRKYLTK